MSKLQITHIHEVTAHIPAEFWPGVLRELCGYHEVQFRDDATEFRTDSEQLPREFMLRMYARPEAPMFRQIIGIVAKEVPQVVFTRLIFSKADEPAPGTLTKPESE